MPIKYSISLTSEFSSKNYLWNKLIKFDAKPLQKQICNSLKYRNKQAMFILRNHSVSTNIKGIDAGHGYCSIFFCFLLWLKRHNL